MRKRTFRIYPSGDGYSIHWLIQERRWWGWSTLGYECSARAAAAVLEGLRRFHA